MSPSKICIIILCELIFNLYKWYCVEDFILLFTFFGQLKLINYVFRNAHIPIIFCLLYLSVKISNYSYLCIYFCQFNIYLRLFYEVLLCEWLYHFVFIDICNSLLILFLFVTWILFCQILKLLPQVSFKFLFFPGISLSILLFLTFLCLSVLFYFLKKWSFISLVLFLSTMWCVWISF